MRALLLADIEALRNPTPIGPSLKLVWNGKVRKCCLGVYPATEGGDAPNPRLLSWVGSWPEIIFNMNLA